MTEENCLNVFAGKTKMIISGIFWMQIELRAEESVPGF